MRARGRRARVIRRDSTRAMVEVGETWCEKNARGKEKKTLETRVRIPAMESKISVPSWSRGMDSSFSVTFLPISATYAPRRVQKWPQTRHTTPGAGERDIPSSLDRDPLDASLRNKWRIA